ncbi:hypothetical protein [Akkermansia glycaniphila]|nr:hypothetical protein [Akkermansia glycaniphila]
MRKTTFRQKKHKKSKTYKLFKASSYGCVVGVVWGGGEEKKSEKTLT